MKRFTLLAFAFTGLAACDVPTATAPAALSRVAIAPQHEKAHNNFTLDISGVIFDSCNNEEVAFEGRYHVVVKEETDASGTTTVKAISNLENFTGVGLTSGANYRIQQNFKDEYTLTLPDFSFDETFEYRLRLNRQGSADNLWIHERVRFTFPPGEVDVIFSDIECRG
jgi:hypothetical protein